MTSLYPVTESIRARARSLTLSASERTRYSRHLLLPEVSEEGQLALKAARVLVVGSGGLGSPVSLYLAAAGVGCIGLVDFDQVDVTNLQRQILFSESDIGALKAQSAKERLTSLNSHIVVEAITERLSSENAESLLSRFDLVVDGTDNFATRYLINDAAVLLGKPVVYGSIFRFDGQASVLYVPYGPCYRCLFPNPPPAGRVPNCAEGGVLGVLPGIIGVVQATEAIKLITGIGTTLIGRLQTYDAAAMKFSEFSFKKDQACPACGLTPSITSVRESSNYCQISQDTRTVNEISVRDFLKFDEQKKPYLLIDVRSPQERSICLIPGAISIPLAQLGQRLADIPRDIDVVVHCKSGQRSLTAVEQLQELGYSKVASLKGGILSWIDETGASVSRY